MRPLAIDLFCGLGGWSHGLIAEGWDVIGFDIEQHAYGGDRYPGKLVLQDIRTIHGSQFRNANLIVASPPCQEFSYMSMPWSRAKQIAGALREEVPFPEPYNGSRTVAELRTLYETCFRIQREASEAAGHHIPLVVENVKGAQPWVGAAKAHFGSFYLWGDVNSVGGAVIGSRPKFGELCRPSAGRKRNPDGSDNGQGSRFKIADSKNRGGRKIPGNDESYRLTEQRPDGMKNSRNWWSDGAGDLSAVTSSHSSARKAASAAIAKIPESLARFIARTHYPHGERGQDPASQNER